MEGVSSEDNEICLEVSPENLSRALKTVQSAKSVKVKLTKKHCPCLTVAAELVRKSHLRSSSCCECSLFIQVFLFKLLYLLKVSPVAGGS